MQVYSRSSSQSSRSSSSLPVVTNVERAGRIALLALVLLAIALGIAPVHAQSYLFSVPLMQMQVYVQPDGTAKIVYDITFDNSLSGSPIDIVDIGLPTNDYDLNQMSASIDGVPLSFIRPSEVVKQGVEIHLQDQAIAPGESHIVHFETVLPDLVFQDVTQRDLASIQITPTWFDAASVLGSTDLQIAIHVPEGVNPDELLYQNEPFTTKALFEGRAVALWEFPDTYLTGPHPVGLSFPKRVVSGVQDMSVWQLASIWFEQQTTLRLVLGALAIALFSFLFFRWTGATGISLWLVLSAGLVYLFWRFPLSLLAALPLLIVLVIIAERRLRKRKLPYMPPIAQVEGGGIKRGLTAPEAAALLDLPINKVLTLIVFGLLKKGILRQAKEAPLQVEVATEYRTIGLKAKQDERYDIRRKAAQQAGVTLQTYEQRFLDQFERDPDKAVKEIDFADPMDWFVRNLAKRMEGFDLSDTQDYYRSIVKKAVDQAKAIEDIPAREQALDRDMEWILLDDGYPQVFNTPTYSYHPSWSRSAGGSLAPSSGGGPAFSPSVSNVAAGFAGWTENTMASLAAAISPASLPSMAGKSGFVNLAGVDRTVGSVFEALSSGSGRSGGGGGGGCACACAGCACACACAGGGR